MVVKAAKCLVGVLCVPRQFQPKTAMVRQHLKDEIVSPLSVSVLMNRRNDTNSSAIREICEKEAGKKAQQCNIKMPPDLSNQFMPKASTITHHLKAEVVSPVSGNIFDDRRIDNDSTSSMIHDTCKEEAKKKIQEYINTLKTGDIKQIQHPTEEGVLSESKLLNSQIKNCPLSTKIHGPSREDTEKAKQCNITLNPGKYSLSDAEVVLPEDKLLSKHINNNYSTTIIPERSGEEIKKAIEYNIKQNLAVSKQMHLKASTIKIPQHLKDEVVSTLAGNILVENRTENKTDNASITLAIQEPSGKETKKNAQKDNTVVTDFPKLFQSNSSSVRMKQFRQEKLSPIPEYMSMKEKNINSPVTTMKEDPYGDDTMKKVHVCDVTMKPSDNMKKGNSVASASKNEHFTLNASPPLPEKLCVAMNVRFNLGVHTEKELKECKIRPKCHNQRENSAKTNASNPNHNSKGPKLPLYTSKASISSFKPIAYQQPKSK